MDTLTAERNADACVLKAHDLALGFGGQRVLEHVDLRLAPREFIAIVGASGVGKSTLLSMMARNTDAEISVVGLIGERGREVREFIDQHLGDDGMKKSVVVVSTGDEPALMRLTAAQTATRIAEDFRDEGLEWMADMVIVSLKTGARKGEVVALIDGEVAISDCGQWLVLTPEVTKTNKARNLPLNDVSRAAAQRLAGTGVYSKRKFERAWAKAQRDVFRGDASAVFHVCRHTAATTLVNDLAVPTVIVADILGHSSLSTTARYAHSKPDALLDIASRM